MPGGPGAHPGFVLRRRRSSPSRQTGQVPNDDVEQSAAFHSATKYYARSDAAGDERIGIGDPANQTAAIWQKDWDIKPLLYKVYESLPPIGLSRELPLQVEGFGLSLVEASACGVPVVACRSGGIPDAVQDGVTGLLVEPGNVEAATQAVRQVLSDEDLARKLGAGGRQEVERRLNWDRVVGDLRAIEAGITLPAVPAGR